MLRRCRPRFALALAAIVAAVVLPLHPAGGDVAVAAEPVPAAPDRVDGEPASLPSRGGPASADRRADPPLRDLWVAAVLVAAVAAVAAARGHVVRAVRPPAHPRWVLRWPAPARRGPPLPAA